MNKYSKPMSNDELDALKWKKSILENQLTGELSDEQFHILDEIGAIKRAIDMVENPQRPDDSNFECFGCGS